MGLTLDQPTSTVLHGVSWKSYLQLGEDAGPGTRMTYDNGTLEIMPPISIGHDRRKSTLADLLTQYLIVREVPYDRIGGTTLMREDLLKGTEPDEGFYINPDDTVPPPEAEELDLAIHSPPNLVIEVDKTSTSIPREPIFAAMGVGELWRWKVSSNAIEIRLLDPGSETYAVATQSSVLPDLPMSALADHLRLASELRLSEVVGRWTQFLRA
ncbi:MAG: Uma2 family endonuclease [Planctomycetota bacterium]